MNQRTFLGYYQSIQVWEAGEGEEIVVLRPDSSLLHGLRRNSEFLSAFHIKDVPDSPVLFRPDLCSRCGVAKVGQGRCTRCGH